MRIWIENGLLEHPEKLLSLLERRCAVISDTVVAPLYAEKLVNRLDIDAFLCLFPSGESYKTRQSKELIEDQMLERGCGRDSCILAIGGGVVSDVAGFVASTYCRGIPYVIIPTTLLGMCDAGIGGKTGVNVPQGKNMIGTIYQPRAICIDPSVLKSLPAKEKRNGVAEMIKHGLIADVHYFEYLETHQGTLFQEPFLTEAITESVRIKKAVVQEDEYDRGHRLALNAGHTIGHALEQLSGYTLAHGEAVAIGMLAESRLSNLDGKSLARLDALVQAFGLPVKPPFTVSLEQLYEVMTRDKKSINGIPHFVKIEAIGRAGACVPLSKEQLHFLW